MRRMLALALAGVVALGGPRAGAAEPTARDWLQRMADALATRDYDGLFIHTAGKQSETMRIIHRMDDGRSVERLVSLDGNGREILRTPGEVHLYMPDRRVVLVEPREDDGSLLKALPAPGPRLDALYTLEVRNGHRLLGRDVRVVDVRPRDQYRYGYRLWLDEASAMPLRSEVLDGAGSTVEAILFTRLEIDEPIDPKDLQPAVDTTGFQWIRAGRRAEPRVAGPPAAGWLPRKMPPGFRLVVSRTQAVPNSPIPMQHLIFSDGFASVSVFIEPAAEKGPSPPESATVGSANAFTTQMSGHVVTAVGEVPAETVRDIATSLAPVESVSPLSAPSPGPTER
jgi:sigma-E factor negative regulatory protein RseB